MRIGVMLRHLGEHGGGVDIYTRRVMPELLRLGRDHEFVLLFKNEGQKGTFGQHPHVREVVVEAKSKILWDQVSVPAAVRREKIDLLFNAKYSLPLMTQAKGVFVIHGMDWYEMPWGSKWQDRLSHRYLMPRYMAKAERIFCVSEAVRQQLVRLFKVPAERTETIHYGVDDVMYAPDAPGALDALKQKHGLNKPYFLYVGQIYPPKNMKGILDAVERLVPKHDALLAIAGEHRWLCDAEMERMRTPQLKPHVRELGWQDRESVRALLRGAQGLIFPSLYEGFGLPIVEAMAAGCPVITSDRWAMKELGEGAALLVNPEDPEAIAAAMRRLLDEPGLREDLIAKGSARVKPFTWTRCAEKTLAALEAAGGVKARVAAPAAA